jgi:hypothetical protein
MSRVRLPRISRQNGATCIMQSCRPWRVRSPAANIPSMMQR